jgi:hypothetical protein
VFKMGGVFSGFSRPQTMRWIKSAKLCRLRKPEARFLAILMRWLVPSAAVLVRDGSM